MRAILEFQLPEEEEEFRLASYAGAIFQALHDVDLALRNRVKYGDLPDRARNELQSIRDVLREACPDAVKERL